MSLKRDAIIEMRINLDNRKFDIKIPLTSQYGQVLRMKNKAEIINGGYPCDILFKLAEKPDINKGILHKIFGSFFGFSDGMTSRKFKIAFKLPWIFEFENEYNFRYGNSNIHGSFK